MKRYLFILVILSGLLSPNCAPAQTAGTLSFTYTPVAHTGSWGLKHVLAVWIQDSTGTFIRTKFRYWGNGTNDHLPIWKTNSNQNITDAITGATLTSYTTRSLTWDGTNLSGTLLPDGVYKVTIEECWSHGTSKVTKSFYFTKNGTVSHLTPADDADFINVLLDWIPSTTGTGPVINPSSFTVFPNPAHDKITIDFNKNTSPCNIYIVNSSGQIVYDEKGNNTCPGSKSIDLSSLENGIYFVNVEMNSKIQTKKIVVLK
jgi:hypothetical protein